MECVFSGYCRSDEPRPYEPRPSGSGHFEGPRGIRSLTVAARSGSVNAKHILLKSSGTRSIVHRGHGENKSGQILLDPRFDEKCVDGRGGTGGVDFDRSCCLLALSVVNYPCLPHGFGGQAGWVTDFRRKAACPRRVGVEQPAVWRLLGRYLAKTLLQRRVSGDK